MGSFPHTQDATEKEIERERERNKKRKRDRSGGQVKCI
jgi:predicted DNA-binding WGR domain protein